MVMFMINSAIIHPKNYMGSFEFFFGSTCVVSSGSFAAHAEYLCKVLIIHSILLH